LQGREDLNFDRYGGNSDRNQSNRLLIWLDDQVLKVGIHLVVPDLVSKNFKDPSIPARVSQNLEWQATVLVDPYCLELEVHKFVLIQIKWLELSIVSCHSHVDFLVLLNEVTVSLEINFADFRYHKFSLDCLALGQLQILHPNRY